MFSVIACRRADDMAVRRQERSASGGSAESAGTAAPAAAGGAAAAAVDDLRRQCAVAAQERAALHTILDAKVAALVADISVGLRKLPEEVSVACAMPSAQRLHDCIVDFFAGVREPGGGLMKLPSFQYVLRRAGVCRHMSFDNPLLCVLLNHMGRHCEKHAAFSG